MRDRSLIPAGGFPLLPGGQMRAGSASVSRRRVRPFSTQEQYQRGRGLVTA